MAGTFIRVSRKKRRREIFAYHDHPFIDGNKRIGHVAMETFLVLNGLEIVASADEQEAVILSVAAGETGRETFTRWLSSKIQPRKS